ncbi:Uu.00g090210.m01.CDS01 [Anthostomella pinea]|uniref:Uu.00g090210.m01.CDS01 n=1 Tax=Anthostomella pinea TaxID=933095 RepID=A0AAI8VMW0_9PEZI|nr:Uu.00g090210.m01.CDS01 [Anthostomella pinea]
MAARPSLFTRGLSSLSQTTDPNSPNVSSPAEQRDDAKRNLFKSMRPLPTQHYWDIYFDRQARDQKQPDDGTYQVALEQLGTRVESVQDFWRYSNNTPVDQIKMRESIYLFKSGFKPVWEDRRNIQGGSWTFRVPKSSGPDFWTRIQLMAIGEKLQESLAEGDQICGVGLSVRFNSHLISIWHRDASKQKSIDGMLQAVLDELPVELRPKPDNYFYKKHSDHAGFKAPPELQVVLDSQKRAQEAATAQNANVTVAPPE